MDGQERQAGQLRWCVFLYMGDSDQRHVYSLGGNGSARITLPFAFPLSGQSDPAQYRYTNADIYADGFVAFVDASSVPVTTPAQNKCLPTLNEPRQAVFGWWADLDPVLPVQKSRPFSRHNDRFVIQYLNVPSAAGVTRLIASAFKSCCLGMATFS